MCDHKNFTKTVCNSIPRPKLHVCRTSFLDQDAVKPLDRHGRCSTRPCNY